MGRVALCCRSPFFAFWVVGAFFFLLYNLCGFGRGTREARSTFGSLLHGHQQEHHQRARHQRCGIGRKRPLLDAHSRLFILILKKTLQYGESGTLLSLSLFCFLGGGCVFFLVI